MTKGYLLLRRILGESILSGSLNRRERGLAKAMYTAMGKGVPILEEWDWMKESPLPKNQGTLPIEGGL